MEQAMQLETVSTAATGRLRCTSTSKFRLSERQYAPNLESPLHAHISTYIIITLEGRYFSTFEKRVEEFKRWTVSYHAAGELHTSRYPEEGARVLYVELPPDELKKFPELSASELKLVSMQGGLAEIAARQLYKEFDKPDPLSPIVMDSLISQLFVQLCRRRREFPQSLPRWLGRADELIREHFSEQVGLDSIAKAVGIHPVHLAREYKRVYNCTVGEQVRRLRIRYACEQLTQTGPSHFRRSP